MSRPRLSARFRIAVAFGVLFFAGGLVILTLVYGLVRSDLLGSASDQNITPGEADTPQQEALEVQVRDQIRDEELQSLLARSGIALVGLTIVSGFTGWTVAGVVLRPVHRITDIAKAASTTNLDRRVHLEGPNDELKDLADTFDSMLDRLQAGIEARRGFAANAAHELRTPLTVIQTATEIGLSSGPQTDEIAEATSDIRSATSQAGRLIDGLLELARSEHGVQEFHDVALSATTHDALGQVEMLAADRHVQIDADVADATVSGDQTLLELAVTNLLTNAVLYNHQGGAVKVALRPEPGLAVIEVTNDGPPIDPESLTELTQPFVRGDGSRVSSDSDHGSGLGLSIVQAVADAHHGHLHLECRDQGGLTVTLTLPRR